jgi:hypothetical protein
VSLLLLLLLGDEMAGWSRQMDSHVSSSAAARGHHTCRWFVSAVEVTWLYFYEYEM